jgi:hypothetical protein
LGTGRLYLLIQDSTMYLNVGYGSWIYNYLVVSSNTLPHSIRAHLSIHHPWGWAIFMRRISLQAIHLEGLVWFGLWCLTPLSTIFQLYRGGQFYWWRKLVGTGRLYWLIQDSTMYLTVVWLGTGRLYWLIQDSTIYLTVVWLGSIKSPCTQPNNS